MNEILLRRVVGALVLLLAAFGLASLVPGTSTAPEPQAAEGAGGPRQVVRYDLKTATPTGLKLESSLRQAPVPSEAAPSGPAADSQAMAQAEVPSEPEPKPAPKPTPKPEPKYEPKPATKPAAPATGGPTWSVQVGSFSAPGNAKSVVERLGKSGIPASLQEVRIGRALWYRVRVGPYGSEAEAGRILKKVQSLDYLSARVLQD